MEKAGKERVVVHSGQKKTCSEEQVFKERKKKEKRKKLHFLLSHRSGIFFDATSHSIGSERECQVVKTC